MSVYESILDQCEGDRNLATEVWRAVIMSGSPRGPRTYQDWVGVDAQFLNDSEVGKLASEKMADLANTFTEWYGVYRRSVPGTEPYQRAIKSMAGLASSFTEFRLLYDVVEGNQELRELAVAGMAKLVK